MNACVHAMTRKTFMRLDQLSAA